MFGFKIPLKWGATWPYYNDLLFFLIWTPEDGVWLPTSCTLWVNGHTLNPSPKWVPSESSSEVRKEQKQKIIICVLRLYIKSLDQLGHLGGLGRSSTGESCQVAHWVATVNCSGCWGTSIPWCCLSSSSWASSPPLSFQVPCRNGLGQCVMMCCHMTEPLQLSSLHCSQ